MPPIANGHIYFEECLESAFDPRGKLDVIYFAAAGRKQEHSEIIANFSLGGVVNGIKQCKNTTLLANFQ
jgi:hypothetical protein